MSCTIPTIPCVTGPVLGGISDMYIIRSKDVLEIPDCCCEDNHTISDPLTIRSSAEFVQLEFRPGTARYSYTQRDTEHGPLYDIEVVLAFRKLSPELDSAVCLLGPGNYVLIFTDHNGYRRLAGSIDSPMRLMTNGTTGARRSDSNVADWKFSGSSRCPVCYLDTDIEFPNSTDSVVAPDPVFGDNDDDGQFEPNDDGVGIIEDPLGGNAGFLRASGFILDEQGQPVGPATDLKIGIDLVNVETGDSLYGEVEIPYTSDINFGSTNATGGAGMTMWNAVKAVFFSGGTGANSLDADAPGRFDFRFNKQLWASSGSKFDTDAVDIELRMKVSDRLFWGNENRLRLQKAIRTPVGSRLHIAEFEVTTVTPSSSGGSYTKDVLTLSFNASTSGYYSVVANTYSIDIDGNTQTGDSTDAIAIGSPSAGNGGITAISGTLGDPVITFSNDSAHSVPITVSYNVSDGVDTMTVAQRFFIVRDDLDTDPYLIHAHFYTNNDVVLTPEDLVDGDSIRITAGFLVENGGEGDYTQVTGAYSELYGFTQQSNPATFEYAWLDINVDDTPAFEVTATMGNLTAPDLTSEDTAYSTCAVRLNTY